MLIFYAANGESQSSNVSVHSIVYIYSSVLMHYNKENKILNIKTKRICGHSSIVNTTAGQYSSVYHYYTKIHHSLEFSLNVCQLGTHSYEMILCSKEDHSTTQIIKNLCKSFAVLFLYQNSEICYFDSVKYDLTLVWRSAQTEFYNSTKSLLHFF